VTPGLHHYLIVSALLFSLGLLGVVARRNLFVIFMGLELMLNVPTSRWWPSLDTTTTSMAR